MDPETVKLLRGTWDEVARHGRLVPKVFYGILFLEYPEVRDLFPNRMAPQHDKFVRALGRVVANAGNLEAARPLLERLGRDHRRFGAIADHYPAVGATLLATLEHFLGERWTPEVEKAWTDAYGAVSNVMIDAACAADHERQPACWDSQIILVTLNQDRDRAFVAFQAPEHLAAEADMVVPAALHAKPGDWLPIAPFPVDGGWAAYVDITDDPRTLALSQAQPGDLLRLGQPGQPIEQLLLEAP
jgi:hemoglobin-like flavoprotein